MLFAVNLLFIDANIVFMNNIYSTELIYWGEEKCSPGHEFGGKRDYFLIHIVLEGTGDFFSHGKKWNLHKGDAFLIQPGQMHHYKADSTEPWTYFWLGFKGEFSHLLTALQLDENHPILHNEGIQKIYALFKKIKAYNFTQHPGLVLENLGILNSILGLIFKNRISSNNQTGSFFKTQSNHVKTMESYIGKNFDTPINVRDVLDFVQLERSYASRIFKEKTGISIGKSILDFRIRQSKQYLKEGWSAKETSYSCGFNDYNNFLKVFKKETGITAGKYKLSISRH